MTRLPAWMRMPDGVPGTATCGPGLPAEVAPPIPAAVVDPIPSLTQPASRHFPLVNPLSSFEPDPAATRFVLG